MLDKYSFMPRSELLVRPPADAGRFRSSVSRSTPRCRIVSASPVKRCDAPTLDQHRSSSEQSALRRSGLHRCDRAGHRPDSFRIHLRQKLPMTTGDGGESVRRDFHRHRLIPISEHNRANLRNRGRTGALRRGCRPASASCFTKVIRAAASNCCAHFSARCDSKPTDASPVSV